jgi:hypothetical protein
MNEIIKYMKEHAIRGACRCGKCIDAGKDPENNQPKGHTVDMMFFEVAFNPENPPNKEDFLKVVKAHKGEFKDVDLFDGKEHSYIELGAWAGDQGLALEIMGVGTLLDCWNLLTPKTMFPPGFNKEFMMEIAGRGLIAIQKK